nr:DUF5753 domain-containing protein [Planosporangium flavigriseum]
MLGVTAADNGDGAWIVRGSRGPASAVEPVTARIRQYQPAALSDLLQTREYARSVSEAMGDGDPDASAEARMRHQEALTATNGPQYDVVLDARALLLAVAPVDLVRNQILSLAVRAHRLTRLDLRVIPLGRPAAAFSATGFTLYDFRAADSPPVARVESPTGDAYFSTPDDIQRYVVLFESLQSVALESAESVRYLRSLAKELERYLCTSA